MLDVPENQIPLTRAALRTSGRATSKFLSLTARHLLLAACLLGSQTLAQNSTTGKPAASQGTEDRFAICNVEGWTVYINRDVPRQHPEETARTLEHLKWELYQIKLAAPAQAVNNMQEKNAIWIEYREKADLSYHPDRA